MNGNTQTISTSNTSNLTAEDLFGQITAMQKLLEELKDKVLSTLPVKYGSDAWWEKSDRESLEDYKEGRYKSFDNVEDLIKELNN